jgi:hypothetical protein
MFTRIIWTSAAAKARWADVLARASNLTSRLEVESVIAGQRPVTWQTISEESVPETMMRWADAGLIGLPIKRVGKFEGFAHRHTPTESGRTGNLCVAVARTLTDAQAFKAAFLANDSVIQGELLGYPRCCGEFFQSSWAAGFIDPIWQAAVNTRLEYPGYRSIERPDGTVILASCDSEAWEGPRRIEIVSSPFSNSLLRYAGIRIGFHISHSFYCEESIRVNTERLKLGEKFDAPLMADVVNLLRMPMSWDCYHGIAIVRTPIFYIELGSIMTAERYVVEVEGDFIPPEGAKGTRFPFMEA